jgi:hypothetical protein
VPSGIATFTGANLPQNFTNRFNLTTNNTFVVLSTNATTLVVNKLTGSMAGSHFIDPVTHKTVLVNGVVFQNQNEAAGWFLGTNRSGEFHLQ